MSEWASDSVKKQFPDFVLETHRQHGDDTLLVSREGLVPILEFLRDDPALDFCMPLDVTCVDRIGLSEPPESETDPMNPMLATHTTPNLGECDGPRFEVVYHLRSLSRGAMIRVKVRVEEDDAVVPSGTAVLKGFNWFEREVYDMFGVRFSGHPDLRRMLLYPEFEGHPLRKDYPRKGYQPLMDMPNLDGDRVPGLEE
ncbi:MAG: NADH-quinone oxidoreductase subunit C [Deltaproteobacteria bacterium]|nr:NADH-quinone oxidoreductase subunit C [Deltaproteobacteria bacterium]